MAGSPLDADYQRLKALAKEDLLSSSVESLLVRMAKRGWHFLQHECKVELLKSEVPGKRYRGFRQAESSRAINQALFILDEEELEWALAAPLSNGLAKMQPAKTDRAIYTMAFSVFAANDVTKVGRKASATFFEVLIGHVVGKAIGVGPRKSVQIPESGGDLPTDFVFDPGGKRRKLHLPIKTSTRERAIQAWAHQLVLNRIFGDGVYRGVLVVAAETKRASRTGAVVEICVPKQLQMFQSRVAEMSRIYYLDPPSKYTALSDDFPKVEIRPFSAFFRERADLLGR